MNLEWVVDILESFGLTEGLFVMFFISAHWCLYRNDEGRLADLRGERDRLAMENLEYRDRFQYFTNKKLDMEAREMNR